MTTTTTTRKPRDAGSGRSVWPVGGDPTGPVVGLLRLAGVYAPPRAAAPAREANPGTASTASTATGDLQGGRGTDPAFPTTQEETHFVAENVGDTCRIAAP